MKPIPEVGAGSTSQSLEDEVASVGEEAAEIPEPTSWFCGVLPPVPLKSGVEVPKLVATLVDEPAFELI